MLAPMIRMRYKVGNAPGRLIPGTESVYLVDRRNRYAKNFSISQYSVNLDAVSLTRCESGGRNEPARQEINVELLAKMGPHRALPASPIGTMWTGDPSTVWITMLERAVIPTKGRKSSHDA